MVTISPEPTDTQRDPAPRDLAEALRAHVWRANVPDNAHQDHEYDAWCAVCTGDLLAIAEVATDLRAQPTADEAEGDEREALAAVLVGHHTSTDGA